jgi:hypothetical protein
MGENLAAGASTLCPETKELTEGQTKFTQLDTIKDHSIEQFTYLVNLCA